MTDLDGVSTDDLRTALANVEGKTPALRLVAAIAYKNGVTQTALSEWLGVERKTIYNWLQRLQAADDLDEAVRDRKRPGRPRKLSDSQLTMLDTVVESAPETYGYDAETWSPSLLQAFVRAEFDVEYTQPSCRRLLAELRS